MMQTVLLKSYRLSLDLRLKDGTPIHIRTLRPRDRILLAQGFKRLSFQSRRFRFLAPLRRLTPRQLDLLTDVDQVNHVAIGAQDASRAGRPGVAVARFVRSEADPTTAEFAITVVDEYQNRGLGTLLLERLLEAAGRLRVRTLRGFLLPENTAMIRLLNRFGAAWSRAWGEVLTAELTVAAAVPLAGKP